MDNASLFKKPAFIASAIFLALVLVAGVVIVISSIFGGKNETAPAPSAKPSAVAPTPTKKAPANGASDSICGLPGVVDRQARISKTPALDEWDYIGTSGFPVHKAYGPGARDQKGFAYCFQHSPEGAIYAAANIIATRSDVDALMAYSVYLFPEGELKETAKKVVVSDDDRQKFSRARQQIKGFRLLAYDGKTAKVDIAYQVSVPEGEGLISAVIPLEWRDGDWRLSDESKDMKDVKIPDLTGYISFGEN